MKKFRKFLLLAIFAIGLSLTANSTNLTGRIQACTYDAYNNYVCDYQYGASVQLFTYDGYQYYVASTVAYTNSEGYYYFYNILPGTYYMLVAGNYYKKIIVDYNALDIYPTLTAEL